MSDCAPLAGCRVVDLGIITAGASTTAILADLGAEVIKVESPTYIDPFRRWDGLARGDLWWNESDQFIFTNRNKLGVAIDLKQERGHELLLKLLERSDILVENFRRGVMENLGLGYAMLHERFPRLIVASVSSQGDSGSLRSTASYGSTLEAMGGLAALTGYTGGPPVITGRLVNYPDQVVSLYASACILDAWRRRTESSHGAHLDISQRELTTYMVGEEMLAHWYRSVVPGGGEPVQRRVPSFDLSEATGSLLRQGNADPAVAFQGCFKSIDGGWVVLTLRDSGDVAAWWRVFRAVTPVRPTPQNGNEMASGANQDVLTQAVEMLVGSLRADDIVSKLTDHGVPAVAIWDDDPQRLGKSDVDSVAFTRTTAGTAAKGLPFVLEGMHMQPSPAPGLGEHNEYVLRDILELGADEVQDLYQAGVIGTRPRSG